MAGVTLQSTGSFLVHQIFEDLEELVVAAKQWNLDFRQLDRGPFRGELLQIGTPSLMFARAQFDRTLHQRGDAPRGFRTIAIPASTELLLDWRGYQVRSNDLLVFPKGRDLDSVSQPDFDMFVYSVPENRLASAGARLGVPDIVEHLDSVNFLKCCPCCLQQLRRTLDQLCRQLNARPTLFKNQAFIDELEDSFFTQLVRAIFPARQAIPASRLRDFGLQRAEAYLEKHAGDPPTVADLCAAAGVSERTLEYAFRERFGLTPKAYLRAYRLNRVRTDLLRADWLATTVAGIANRWGFWHIGQFARDYRMMFGENPSATLRRHPG